MSESTLWHSRFHAVNWLMVWWGFLEGCGPAIVVHFRIHSAPVLQVSEGSIENRGWIMRARCWNRGRRRFCAIASKPLLKQHWSRCCDNELRYWPWVRYVLRGASKPLTPTVSGRLCVSHSVLNSWLYLPSAAVLYMLVMKSSASEWLVPK